MKFHLQNEGSLIAQRIADSIYVDNVSIGTDSVEGAYQIYKEARSIFKKASMNLQQWTSNSDEFLHLLLDDQKLTEYVVKLFGLLWNRIDDYIQITGADIVRQCFTITK